jgi:hypothetical protein
MGFTIPRIILEVNPRVVPIRNGQKGPSVPNWTKTEIRAEDLVDSDGIFECSDHDAYGIVLDDDLVIVDIDCHDGGENGYATLSQIEEETGVDLWDAAKLVVKTPSGGAHLYFTKDESLKLKKSLKEFPAIDVLQTGAQALGPGSRGGRYSLEHDSLPIPLPQQFSDVWRPQEPREAPSAPLLRDASDSPIDAFNRSEDGVRVIKDLLEAAQYRTMWKGDGTFEFVRPGKREGNHAISGTLGRESREGRKILRNFSTSDPQFPSDGSITIAEAYRILNGLTLEELPAALRSEGYGSSGVEVNVSEIQRQLKEARTVGEDLEDSYPTLSLEELIDRQPERRPYVIDGLLRRGETMNLIAAPKTGKSWFVYGLATTLSTGGEFCGFTSPNDLKCLIVDNELHPEELSWRIQKVTNGTNASGKDLHFCPLRGVGADVHTLASKLEAAGAGRFDVIILDAMYRFLPQGISENDNAAITQVYNALDRIANQFACSVILVHHTSKGDQSEKSALDAGAGAGAISRATDTQMVLFPHENGESVVIECVTRSSKRPRSRCAKIVDCKWEYQPDLEPKRAVAGRKEGLSAGQQKSIQYGLDRVAKARQIGDLLDGGVNLIREEHLTELGMAARNAARFVNDWLVPALVVQEVGKNKWRPTSQWQKNLQKFLECPFRVTESEEIVTAFQALKS